ncbi:MAG: SMP-30/gluconolactonase/LRE family protein [Gemmatimonadaceae bacterium]
MHASPSRLLRLRTALASASLGVALVGCDGGRTPPADSSAATPDVAAAPLPAPIEGLKVPESVRYDPALDAYFISNIDGVPSKKDNNGYIVRVDAANPAVQIVLVRGGERGTTLHAPKGMVIIGDTIWVADIDAVRAFDKNTGTLVSVVEMSGMGATFLNDVAVGGDGAIYITDTGVRFSDTGEMSHPGKDRIFVIRGRSASVAFASDSLLTNPNGIAWDAANDRFLLAPFGSPNLSAWKPGDKSVTTIATGPGGFDGLEVLADGRALVTSWADSSINILDGDKLVRLAGGLEAPADIGVDTKRSLVAVPLFNQGKVQYLAIPPK